jgi:energy-coupling factor transport system permease protein
MTLDSRAWLAWAAAIMLPLLLGRNPYMLVALFAIVLAVRAAWSQIAARQFAAWGWFLRLALVVVLISVLFNVLTVHAGETVLVHLSDRLPIIGGALTFNALVFGLLSGLAIFTLVLTGTTVAALLDWSALMRTLPARATPFAVAGSVAWSFLPQSAVAWREIREAQEARGHRIRGPRDLPPLIIPLLAGALERAMTMAESLESRGFGATGTSSQVHGLATALASALAALAAFALASGRLVLGAVAGVIALAGFAFAWRGGTPGVARTRYRTRRWRRADSIMVAGAATSALVTLVRLQTTPAGLHYEPYPVLAAPHVDLVLLFGLALLLAPAFLLPAEVRR